MARLKREKNRTVGNTTYYRYLIADIPRKELENLAWKTGDHLDAEARGDHLIVRKRAKRK